MGGGHWNGKNHGGEHTGNGKKSKCGPYTADGYTPDPHKSHLDYEVDDTVSYVGSNKFKQKEDIPNGSNGTIMEKNNLKNKRQKTPRSLLLVDFGDYGRRYVRKELLQHTTDYSDCIEDRLDKCEDKESFQDYRNEKKKVVKEKLRPEDYKRILRNRKKIKEFREWRKDHLDTKLDELRVESRKFYDMPENKQKRERRKKVKEEIEEIKERYDNETVYETEYMLQMLKEGHEDKDKIQKMYNAKKVEDINQSKYLRQDLLSLNEYFDACSTKHKKINETISDGNKQFIRNVSSKGDYNNYLHATMNGETYKYKGLEPSRKYEIDATVQAPPKVQAPPSDNINLLMWGLYPQDVH